MRTRIVTALLMVGSSVATAAIVQAGDGVAAETAATTPRCTNETLNGGYGIIGTGAGVGADVGLATTMVFHGAGTMSGHGTAVFTRPALPFRYEIRDGTYTLKPDCTGTMAWYANFPGQEPINHSHTADIVVSDGGKQLMLVYTSTTFPDAPTGPYVSITAWGRRM